jgi:hypothetical protein
MVQGSALSEAESRSFVAALLRMTFFRGSLGLELGIIIAMIAGR